MNVLLVPSWYKNNNSPNLGSFFYEQASMLKKRGINVIVANATLQARNNYFDRDNFSLQKYYDGEILTYRYTVPSFGLNRFGQIGAFIFKRSLLKIIRAIESDGIKIDLIHAHAFAFAGYVSTVVGKEKGIPVVVTEHNSLVLKKDLDQQKQRMLSYTVNNADAFVCVSNALRKAVEEITSIPVRYVIPNVLNPLFSFKKLETGTQFVFISIGNMVSGKRFDLTIKAFSEIHKVYPHTFLYVVGKGPLLDTYKAIAKDYNVSDSVQFTGLLSREAVVELIGKSNIMVLPSDFETFGLVYIEALACGRPVIATKNGGANEIVEERNGYLIDCDNIGALREAMINSINDYKRFDLIGISDSTIKKYGEENIFYETYKLYNSILGEI